MDDPGTLIYLAFLVISLIAGYFQNRKKKAQQAPPPIEVPVETFVPDQRAIEKAEREAELRNKAAEERIAEMERAALEAKAASRRRSKRVQEVEMLEETEDLDEEHTVGAQILGEEFDARKAIIYSEILKRPHHE